LKCSGRENGRKKDFLNFAGHIQGLSEGILHLDSAILDFTRQIQGFGHLILKFTNSKQFNVLEMVSVGEPTNTFLFVRFFYQGYLLIGMETATPAETTRTEDPGLSFAKEAAEDLPAESVRRNGNQHFLFFYRINKKIIFQ